MSFLGAKLLYSERRIQERGVVKIHVFVDRIVNGKNIFIQFTVYICTVRTWPVTIDQVTFATHCLKNEFFFLSPLNKVRTAVESRSKSYAQIRQLSIPCSPTGLAVYSG